MAMVSIVSVMSTTTYTAPVGAGPYSYARLGWGLTNLVCRYEEQSGINMAVGCGGADGRAQGWSIAVIIPWNTTDGPRK